MSPAAREAEVKLHGRHACRAAFARRPGEVRRAYVASDAVRAFGDLLHAFAERRLPYKVVPTEELEAITDSKHHEGICLVVRPRREAALDEVLRAPGPARLLALSDVSNPHNVGAILRIAAHFGVRAALLGGRTGARLPPAAYRTAQGGAEWVELVGAPELPAALAACRAAGLAVCATTSHQGRQLFAERLPARAVVLLGSEGEGLPRALVGAADLVLRIPGTGHVESLNVAAAASVLLAELWRQHEPPGAAERRR